MTGPHGARCALGNDRTGVVIAVLLDAVGVDRSAILADYTATNDVLATALPALAEALGLTDRLELIPFAARTAHPDALTGMFDHLDRDHGGAGAWLRACDQQSAAARRGQQPGEGGDHGSIGPVDPWSGSAALQHGQLVAQDEDLDLLGHVGAGA